MKNLKHILLFLPLLLIFSACKKVKLVDKKNSKLVGTWSYSSSGVHQYDGSFTEFSSYPYKNCSITFLSEGEINLNINNEIVNYRITTIKDKNQVYFSEWKKIIWIKNKDSELYFILEYYNADSIKIGTIPYDLSEHGEHAGNIFHRVE